MARGARATLGKAVAFTILGLGASSTVLLTAVVLFAADAFLPRAAAFPTEDFATALLTLLPVQAAKTFLEFGTLVVQAALRGRGRTALVCRVQASVTFLVWIPAYLLVRAFHPTVVAYWWTMVLSGAASVALLLPALRAHPGVPDRS